MSSTTTEAQTSNVEWNGAAPRKKTRKVLRKKQPQPKPIKKYVWLAGHALTLGFGGVYIALYVLRYFFRWFWIRQISYRLSFIGVLASYSVTVLTTFGSVIPSFHSLLATENFQSLLLAGIWLISRASAFKLFPYYIISLLQISATYNIKPILKLQSTLGDFIAFSEIAVIFALLFDTLLFKGTSGFALVFYVGFYWLRINFSPYTQVYILNYVKLFDQKIVSKQKPEFQAKWKKIVDFVEFRRNQTEKAVEGGLDTEPKVDPSPKDHSNANKVIGKTENYQVGGTDQSTATEKPKPSDPQPNTSTQAINATGTNTGSTPSKPQQTQRPAQLNTNQI